MPRFYSAEILLHRCNVVSRISQLERQPPNLIVKVSGFEALGDQVKFVNGFADRVVLRDEDNAGHRAHFCFVANGD